MCLDRLSKHRPVALDRFNRTRADAPGVISETLRSTQAHIRGLDADRSDRLSGTAFGVFPISSITRRDESR